MRNFMHLSGGALMKPITLDVKKSWLKLWTRIPGSFQGIPLSFFIECVDTEVELTAGKTEVLRVCFETEDLELSPTDLTSRDVLMLSGIDLIDAKGASEDCPAWIDLYFGDAVGVAPLDISFQFDQGTKYLVKGRGKSETGETFSFQTATDFEGVQVYALSSESDSEARAFFERYLDLSNMDVVIDGEDGARNGNLFARFRS